MQGSPKKGCDLSKAPLQVRAILAKVSIWNLSSTSTSESLRIASLLVLKGDLGCTVEHLTDPPHLMILRSSSLCKFWKKLLKDSFWVSCPGRNF